MRVLVEFHDMYDMKVIYKVGDDFSCDDKDRIKNLIKLGYIEDEISSSINSTINNNIDNLTKIKQTIKKKNKGS